MSCSCRCHDILDGRWYIENEDFCEVCESIHEVLISKGVTPE